MVTARSDYYVHFDDHGSPLDGWSVWDGRLVFGPTMTRLIGAVMWVRNAWFEQVSCRIGRVNCRLLRRHNVTCRGRRDHCPLGVGLIDPDRWNGWPRR